LNPAKINLNLYLNSALSGDFSSVEQWKKKGSVRIVCEEPFFCFSQYCSKYLPNFMKIGVRHVHKITVFIHMSSQGMKKWISELR
jgi:hypothetical protein